MYFYYLKRPFKLNSKNQIKNSTFSKNHDRLNVEVYFKVYKYSFLL